MLIVLILRKRDYWKSRRTFRNLSKIARRSLLMLKKSANTWSYLKLRCEWVYLKWNLSSFFTLVALLFFRWPQARVLVVVKNTCLYRQDRGEKNIKYIASLWRFRVVLVARVIILIRDNQFLIVDFRLLKTFRAYHLWSCTRGNNNILLLNAFPPHRIWISGRCKWLSEEKLEIHTFISFNHYTLSRALNNWRTCSAGKTAR